MFVPDVPERAGARLMRSAARRVIVNEAVGVLQFWHGCGTGQVRRDLVSRGKSVGQEFAAVPVAVIVDSSAQRRADPDWH